MSRSTVRRPVLAGLGLALVGVIVVSDLRDDEHALWSDPISFYGSDGAPHPVLYNLLLALVGVAVLLLAWRHRARLGPVSASLVGVVGGSLVVLALAPIDCSPADDVCAEFIRARLVSDAHVVHSVVAVVLLAALTGLALTAAVDAWRQHWAPGWRAAATLVAAAAVLAFGAVVSWPLDAPLGLLQLVLIGAGAVGLSLPLLVEDQRPPPP